MKTIKDMFEVYAPKSPDEQKFVKKHVVVKHPDRNEVNGKANGDDVFKATNIKAVEREKTRHGYNVGQDEKVYEENEFFFDEELIDEARMNKRQKAEKEHHDALWAEFRKVHGPLPMGHGSGAKYLDKWEKHKAANPMTEESEQVAEMRGRSYATLKPGYYHKGPVSSNKPLNPELQKGLEAIDAAFKKARSPNKAVTEELIDERNKENKLKKDMYVVGKGREAIAKSFAGYDSDDMSKSKGHDYHLATTDDDEYYRSDELKAHTPSTLHAARKTTVRKAKVAGRKVLAKEDIINRAIEKYMPEVADIRPLTIEERLAKRLEGFSEGHTVLLFSLFTNLNEENQLKMIDACNDREGVIQLIDFALENNGGE